MHHNDQTILRAAALLTLLHACGGDDATGYVADSENDGGTAVLPLRDAGSGVPVPQWVDSGTDASRPATDAGPHDDADAQTPIVTGPKAYIGLFGDGAIAVFDIIHQRVVKTLPVSAPDGLVVTPDGAKVYVSSTDTGTVKVIRTSDDTLAGSIDVGAKPAGLALTVDGRLLVVAVGGADQAAIVDTASDAVVRRAPVGQAHASCVTHDGHFAYVGSQVTSAPAVVRVDLTQDVPPTSIPVDKSPRMLACEDDRIYFTAVGLDAVEQLDPATNQLGTPIPTGASPHDVRAAQPGRLELIVSQTAGDLEFLDIPSGMIVAHLLTGKLAHWIAVTADGTHAYVTNEGDDNVSFVDLTARAVLATIPVGKAPRKMALRP